MAQQPLSPQTFDVAPVATPFREEIKEYISSNGLKLKLVGFLASADPSAKEYAKWTALACKRDGIEFELREISRMDLEDALIEANEDKSVHGVIVYHPVFGSMMDGYLQDVVSIEKDVEGLNTRYRYNLYHNIRFFDTERTKKCILPCTPLAIIKIIDYLAVCCCDHTCFTCFTSGYDKDMPEGQHLAGKTVTVINRSEIVGRPLAAMLANDGAIVYSVDINGIIQFQSGKVPGTIKMMETDITLEQAIRNSSIVVTGVPSQNYKIPSDWISHNSVVINFSNHLNVEESIKDKAVLVPNIGRVTIAMLERNLLTLFKNFHQNSKC